MKCNKPYSVTSSNPKMSGSEKPMRSYMGGGMIKSYQKGGVITMPRMTAEQEMMANLKKAGSSPYSGKSKKDAVARAEMKERIMGPQEKRKGPGTYTPQAWRQREMEMAMPEPIKQKKSKITVEEVRDPNMFQLRKKLGMRTA